MAESQNNTLFLPQFLYTNNQLLEVTEEETSNGLHLNNICIPEEIILHILAFVEPKELLKCSLVCRKWNQFIKSYTFWSEIYRRKYNNKPKQLPWHVLYCLLATDYFDTNLLRNGNGQEEFNQWELAENRGNRGFVIEDPPVGTDPLPLDVSEFHSHTSCFATSCGSCCKRQWIKFGNSDLFRYILNTYKPPIYLSEWTACRFDCSCTYKLRTLFHVGKMVIKPSAVHQVLQGDGSKWKKIEMIVTEYPQDLKGLVFEHIGDSTQQCSGHYSCKMAGGIFKLLFDSMEPLPVNEKAKEFAEIKYHTNGEKELLKQIIPRCGTGMDEWRRRQRLLNKHNHH